MKNHETLFSHGLYSNSEHSSLILKSETLRPSGVSIPKIFAVIALQKIQEEHAKSASILLPTPEEIVVFGGTTTPEAENTWLEDRSGQFNQPSEFAESVIADIRNLLDDDKHSPELIAQTFPDTTEEEASLFMSILNSSDNSNELKKDTPPEDERIGMYL